MLADTRPVESVEVTPPSSESEAIMDYLLAHKMGFMQGFLKERGLHYSGTKKRLRERLGGYIESGKLTIGDFVGLLDSIEGWGDQHVYLYEAPKDLSETWSDSEKADGILKKAGLETLKNRRRPLLLPETPTLSTIEWSSARVRFVWIEKRAWEERVPDQDCTDGNMVWRAYRLNISRGIVSFDWDLLAHTAALLIRQLPSGSQYVKERDRFSSELAPILDLGRFRQVSLSPAMRVLDESSEVRRRQTNMRTRRGGTATFISPRKSEDIRSDPDLLDAKSALRDDAMSVLGNYYWLVGSSPDLVSDLHMKIYEEDQRLAIFGERAEGEVRYVLSRIRGFLRPAPGSSP